MLRKKDLVKQFELLVQQEIKNHNDAILASNILANKLMTKVDQLSESHHKEAHEIRNLLYETRKEVSLLESNDSVRVNRLSVLENRLDHMKLVCFESERDSKKRIDKSCEFIHEQGRCIDDLHKEISSLEEKHLEQSKTLHYEIEKSERKFRKMLDALDNKITEAPCKSEEKIASLEKKLELCEFAAKSLYEEMENSKNKTIYNEKKIEHLLALTERLQNRI